MNLPISLGTNAIQNATGILRQYDTLHMQRLLLWFWITRAAERIRPAMTLITLKDKKQTYCINDIILPLYQICINNHTQHNCFIANVLFFYRNLIPVFDFKEVCLLLPISIIVCAMNCKKTNVKVLLKQNKLMRALVA